ncbi:zinc-dependent metalloprotease [Syncephalis pseudoplumigaleata]|uniref:Extracellular metalloproteinase n=1 Tax=Syncephalis pseudoplumigaleata TaxID=1712513 RepID=A0A4P9YV47_9FUNG|nr:zinc-dependent metalloprotease [Syncephalis pseudoplumigaleata]|eukprot:RKP23923.1 zinc-dependent metalloprotease [Syncephalis pseudoplumigaleata]
MRVTSASLALLVLALVGGIHDASAARIHVPLIKPGPKGTFETATVSPKLRQAGARFTAIKADPEATAIRFVRQHLGVLPNGFAIKNAYRTELLGLTHFYFRQLVKNTEVANGDIAVHVGDSGRIVAYSDSFYRSAEVQKQRFWNGPSSASFVRPRDAFKTFVAYIRQEIDVARVTEVPVPTAQGEKPKYELRDVPFARTPVTVQQSYIHTVDGHLEPTWEFFVRLEYNYFHAHVSANGEKLLSLSDWMSPASYMVVQAGGKDVGTSSRTLVADPDDKQASPKGWQDFSGTHTNTTRGNNVEAMVPNDTDATAPGFMPVAAGDNFTYPLDLSKEPSTYREAAVTNLFYMNNVAHDMFYHYGFDEAAGNFQKDNYGKGGQGNDDVLAYAQDPTDMNNADFFTPPDGEQPTMRMYIWDKTSPHRDGTLENDIVIHEYSHGVSNRLTGGPANTDCLFDSEASGMGEGWGDFFAIWLRLKSTDKRDMVTTLGNYVNTQSIRAFSYATDMAANPTTYDYLNKDDWQLAHQIGLVWGNILYEMYWNFVDKLGFTDDKKSADPAKGNTLAMVLIVSAMKLQPCNPTFVSGRDAILQAEQLLTHGQHKCAIWAAFAKRGVGVNAKSEGFGPVVQDNTMPADCKSA